MGKNRLEAFSDGVIAILITIMVLELKVPYDPDFRALLPLWPVFMSYVLSFIYMGIYWNKLQYGSYPQQPAKNLILNPPIPRMMKCSLLVLACGMSPQANAETAPVVRGDWFAPRGSGSFSAVAQNACQGVKTPPADLKTRSPDGKIAIVVRSTKDDSQTFAVDKAGKQFTVPTAGWPCPEIGWSSASDRFFLNYSDGGNVGTFHVAVYHLAKGKLEAISLTQAVNRDFAERYPKCFRPETPNIVGIAWSKDATRMLLAAQVLPHSNCDNMGTFMMYEVAVPNGAIIRRFSQAEAKTSFRKLLGSALQAADDGCFSEPGSCFIPMLHEAEGTQPLR
jgi:hypothetical protein